VRSMTGFAEAAEENGRRRVEVVVQGWNHRHLDVVIRLPEELRSRESEIRERIGARVRRGRCDLSVRVSALGPRGARVRIDQEAIRALYEEMGELIREGRVEPTLTLGDLLRQTQLAAIEPEPIEWGEADLAMLLRVVDGALESFDGARRGEGARLAEVLERGRQELIALVARLEARREEASSGIGPTLRARLDELLEGGVGSLPADRLAQEVALLIERGDVREEIDRLCAHLAHFAEAGAADGTVGKRLDFLAQEILRELNTLGAKSRDAEMTRLVVESKVVCEQLREQIQNVE